MKQQLQYNFVIHALVKTLNDLDIAYEPILTAAGISLETTQKTPSIVSKQQLTDLCYELLQQVDQPGLGLLLGAHTDSSDLGAVGYLGLTSPTLRDLVEVYQKYRKMLSNIFKAEAKYTSTEFIWQVKAESPLQNMHRVFVEWELAADITTLSRALGQTVIPSAIYIDYPAPDYAQQYQDLFQCPIHFNHATTEVHFPIEILDLPLPRYDPMIKNAMEELCQRMAAKIIDSNDVVGEVKILLQDGRGTFPSLEYIAEKMHISSRTLHRRLKEKNTTFQTLLDDARKELAEHYLAETELQIQQIAELCGFGEAQNFSLAFKRWTGLPPSEYRASLKQRDNP